MKGLSVIIPLGYKTQSKGRKCKAFLGALNFIRIRKRTSFGEGGEPSGDKLRQDTLWREELGYHVRDRTHKKGKTIAGLAFKR